jgi:hypothetical protein
MIEHIEVLRKKLIKIFLTHKTNYAKQVRNGLGKHINDFNSYIKKEPTRWMRFKNFISKIFRYI